MSEDNKALQDLFDTVHYNEDLVDRSSDEDEIDPDDDEDYEPELTPEQQLGMMTDEEFEAYVSAYLKGRRGEEV